MVSVRYQKSLDEIPNSRGLSARLKGIPRLGEWYPGNSGVNKGSSQALPALSQNWPWCSFMSPRGEESSLARSRAKVWGVGSPMSNSPYPSKNRGREGGNQGVPHSMS